MPAPSIDAEIGQLLSAVPAFATLNADILPKLRNDRRLLLAQIELSDDVDRVDHTIPGPPGDPDIIVRVHTPKGLTGPAPCIYSIHGGGYVLGSREMDDIRFDVLSTRLGAIGVSVEYRLAPETPYPGPLEDCYAGLQWVHRHAEELRIDRARIGISGASAGGGLAAALALLARDRGELPVSFQLLAYPMIDDRQTTPSSGWDVPIWNPGSNTFGWQAYLGDRYGSADIPYTAAPARATDLSGLPPALVFVGTLDGFCDEDVDYATRLWQAGVPTELHVYPGAPHGFDAFADGSELARRCHRHVQEWLTTALTLTT
ncbi:MAG TPA: alpha/beta hydrolase [Acidimicrobiales bacterium]|jgi:acetyl esterase/lipase|nr:alpha/beta hydrolase [Acidimicrobiales bacterium]